MKTKITVGKQNVKMTIIFAMIGIIFAFTYMTVHEQVHAAIFRSYEISSVSRINWLSASTQPLNQSEYDLKCTPNCILANNLTDVVGYHTAILIFCLTGLFYFTQLTKGPKFYEKEKGEKNENESKM
jgi:hypothetical protein